ncbi:hypothetical protein PQX77_019479 [Marasmius sp. AFHP31]|nr:hypothetical protein PQX77_019479 [Marasmius sp. AFHP31]
MDWTDNQFFVILAYAVNSGALASIFSITCPIAYALMPGNFVWLALRNVLTALYLNCLFAMLNAKQYLEDWGGGVRHKDVYVYNGTGFHQRSSQPLSSTKGSINEVGLPFFHNQTNKQSSQLISSLHEKMGMKEIPLVEVNVVRESAHESDSDSKAFHRDRDITKAPLQPNRAVNL